MSLRARPRGVRMLPRRCRSQPSRPAPAHRHPVGALFSQISGKFSKSLIFGCFFPVAFFILLDWIFFRPFIPPMGGVVSALRALDPQWQGVAMAGLTVLFSGLLYTLNTPIIRFYEGYPWAHSYVGQALVWWQKRRWSKVTSLAYGVSAVVGAGTSVSPAAKGDLRTLAEGMLRRFRAEFPSQASSVLPTRLGNVIRSFEDYPRRQYGMSAIPLWPRLVAVIDPGYAESADDAKSSFDFMINVSFLSAVSCIALLLAGLTWPTRGGGLSLAFWMQVLGLAVMSRVFYAGSIGQAATWGNLVRGAFDLYRGKLLEQMGFAHKPADLHEERALWSHISRQMIFGDPPAYTGIPLMRYATGGTFAVGTPPDAQLRISRSAAPVGDGWQTCVVLHNPHKHSVAGVRLTDTLPDGERYVWNSALSGGTPLGVTGINPITLEVGTLLPGEQRIVVYRTAK